MPKTNENESFDYSYYNYFLGGHVPKLPPSPNLNY